VLPPTLQFGIALPQVRSELRFQPPKLAHLRSYFSQFWAQQLLRRFARVHAAGAEVPQFSDFPEGEAECLHALDETYALDVLRGIHSESPGCSHCLRKQPALLIEADRVDRQRGSSGNFADLQHGSGKLVICRHDEIIQSGA
jgi:hypothetical protein